MYFIIAKLSKPGIVLLISNSCSLRVVGDRLAAKPTAQHTTTAVYGLMRRKISEEQRRHKFPITLLTILQIGRKINFIWNEIYIYSVG